MSFGVIIMKKVYVVFLLLLGCLLMVSCHSDSDRPNYEILKYNNDEYFLIQYENSVFNYGYNGNEYIEEDTIYPVNDAILYMSGDLYYIEKGHKEYEESLKLDDNFNWFVSVDEEKEIPLVLTESEIAFFDNVEDQERDLSIYVDEIEKFATLSKVSKDGMIRATTELAYYQGKWYWRSEIINEEREKDGTWPEYVYEIPQSLGNKIK